MKTKSDKHKIDEAANAVLDVFSKMKLDQVEGLSAISMILMASLIDSNATKDQALQMLSHVWDKTEIELKERSRLH